MGSDSEHPDYGVIVSGRCQEWRYDVELHEVEGHVSSTILRVPEEFSEAKRPEVLGCLEARPLNLGIESDSAGLRERLERIDSSTWRGSG